MLGGLIALGTVYLCSFFKNPTIFIYCYGCAFGVGKGLMYSSALQAAWTHLQERIGLVSGIVLCSYGIGGFTFGMISARLANPDNEEVQIFEIEGRQELLFPTSVAFRAPYLLRTLVMIWVSLLIFGVLCLSTFNH